MVSLLFTKPGKVMVYPKVMNTISNSVSTGDISQDPNGFAPDYEGIVPGWIQNLWAYQIADRGEEDEYGQRTESYANLSTPQFDSYRALTNPGNMAYGLLSPAGKIPDQALNMATGHSVAELVGQEPPYVSGGVDGALSGLMRNMPQTNYLQKIMNDNAGPEEGITFGTGIGIYRNDTERRRMEGW
jgi:hypothetical protein